LADLRRYHPKIVVVMLGANDMQSFSIGNGRYLSFSMTARTWWQAYAARVALVMEEATSARRPLNVGRVAADGGLLDCPAGFPEKLNRVFLAEHVRTRA